MLIIVGMNLRNKSLEKSVDMNYEDKGTDKRSGSVTKEPKDTKERKKKVCSAIQHANKTHKMAYKFKKKRTQKKHN